MSSNVHYTIAILISTVLGIVFNFFSLGYIVFRNTDLKKIFVFVAAYVFIYFVNIFFFHLFQENGVNKFVSQAACLPIIAVLSFVLNNSIVFRKYNKR